VQTLPSNDRGVLLSKNTIGFLFISIQVFFVCYTFPIEDLLNSTPLFTVDSPFHWYNIVLSSNFFSAGALIGYTLSIMHELHAVDPNIAVVDLSRNFGKEIATTAGIDHAKGDALVVIDADLQDPPELIEEMIGGWREGYDVVYAQRLTRDGETWVKRKSAEWFYKVMQKLGPVTMPPNTGDFRLMSRPAIDAIRMFPEQHRFMKGLFAWIGFSQKAVHYTVVDFLIFAVLSAGLDFNVVLANVIAFSVAVTNSFVLNHRFTFGNRFDGDFISAYFKFVFVNTGGLAISTATVYLLDGIVPALISKLVAIALTLFTSYFASHFFIYRTRTKRG